MVGPRSRGPRVLILNSNQPATKIRLFAKFFFSYVLRCRQKMDLNRRTDGRTDRQQRYMNSAIHADQEYIYFIGSKVIISMCYKRLHKINMLFYLQVNNIKIVLNGAFSSI